MYLHLWPDEETLQDYLAEQAIIQSGQPMINREKFSPASKRWRSEARIPLRDSQGQIVGLVGINRVITERKRAKSRGSRPRLCSCSRRGGRRQRGPQPRRRAANCARPDLQRYTGWPIGDAYLLAEGDPEMLRAHYAMAPRHP